MSNQLTLLGTERRLPDGFRYEWEHIPAVDSLRYSITFRSMRV